MVVFIPAIVWGLLALTGLYLVRVTVRDVVTGGQVEIQESRDETIQAILDDPTLTPEQEARLIEAYIKRKEEEAKTETEKIMEDVMKMVIIIAVAYLAATYMKGK